MLTANLTKICNIQITPKNGIQKYVYIKIVKIQAIQQATLNPPSPNKIIFEFHWYIFFFHPQFFILLKIRLAKMLFGMKLEVKT